MPVTEIKKYANRRLYDTAASSYITLQDVAHLIQKGRKVKISDAKTGEDLTSATLLQIMTEIHNEGTRILSPTALSLLIAYDKDETRMALSAYIDEALSRFDEEHDSLINTDHQNQKAIEEIRSALRQLTTAFAKWDR
ncbi:MAG: polyhydroxyalkanoate synthesis regulator DNA-binding domain-containing protein [Candidatus Puniceispirillaceae bacterium]